MGCRKAHSYLNAYLDNELPLEKRLYLENHLADCKACRERLIVMQRLDGQLRDTAGVPPVPEDLAATIMREAARRKRRTQFSPEVHFPLAISDVLLWVKKRSLPVRVAFGAVVVLAFIVGVTLETNRQIADLAISRKSQEMLYGFEWFGPTMPGSIEAGYISLAAQNDRGRNQSGSR